MRQRNKVVFGIAAMFCILLTSAFHKKDGKQELIDVERAFSKLCGEKGVRESFVAYMDPDQGTLLRQNQYPLVGAKAVEFLSRQKYNPNVSLTWEPQFAEIASSGDLGFTYGVYTFKTADTTLYGTYTSFWKKDPQGAWKFLLDTGNPGLGKTK